MVKHTQTIRRQIADELLECVWPFCEIGTKTANPLRPKGGGVLNKRSAATKLSDIRFDFSQWITLSC